MRKGNGAEEWWSSEEEDSRSEKERERTPGGVLGYLEAEALGSQGQCSRTTWGSLFECRFWLNGTGVRFWHF